jgi:hypothetical protein
MENPKTPLPETITIWHSSLPENKESILKNGVTMAKFNLDEQLQMIEKSNALKGSKEQAKRRLFEAFDEPCISGLVCCSGSREYSIQNGRAALEVKYYLDCKNFHGPVAVFKIVLPLRMLEVLTPNYYRYLITRFEELWGKGWFKARMWEARAKKWKGMSNVVATYDHFVLTHVPPEYIKGVEIIEQPEN